MNTVFKIIFLLLIFSFSKSFAQRPLIDKDVMALMDKAKSEIQQQTYKKANSTFREMLATKKVMPTDMSYLFAETLYAIDQHENSKNFLNKYLKLTGEAGNYYEQAIQLKTLLENKEHEITDCSFCNVKGYELVSCQLCEGIGTLTATCHYCKGAGKTACQTCYGEGVLITKNKFGKNEYESCPTCHTTGFTSCPVCLGKKVLETQCPDCIGSGNVASKKICEHNHDIE